MDKGFTFEEALQSPKPTEAGFSFEEAIKPQAAPPKARASEAETATKTVAGAAPAAAPETAPTPEPAAPGTYVSPGGAAFVPPKSGIRKKPAAPVTAQPEPQPEPSPYRSRIEALDDAVNLLEEGANQQKIIDGFKKIGISWEDIIRHGVARKSPFFAGQQVEAKAPEMPIGAKPGTDFIRPLKEEPIEVELIKAAANSFRRVDTNFSDMATAFLFQTGAIDPDQAANLLRRNARDRASAAPSMAVQEGMQEIGNAKTYGDAAQAMFNNPAATFTMLVDSVLQTAPALAAAITLAPAGAVVAGATAFASSAGMEYASVMTDVLQDKGVDLTNPEKVARALRDPKILEEMKDKGAKRGLIVGLFDGISMGLAGKFLKPANALIAAGKLTGAAAKKATVAAWGKELAMQAGAGSGGEFLAQQATGDNKPAEVLLEGLAEGATGPLEVRSNLREAAQLEAAARARNEPRIPPDLMAKVKARRQALASKSDLTEPEAGELDLLTKIIDQEGRIEPGLGAEGRQVAPDTGRTEPAGFSFEEAQAPAAGSRVEPTMGEAPARAPAAAPRVEALEAIPGMPTGEEIEAEDQRTETGTTVTPVTVAQAPAAETVTPAAPAAPAAAPAAPQAPASQPFVLRRATEKEYSINRDAIVLPLPNGAYIGFTKNDDGDVNIQPPPGQGNNMAVRPHDPRSGGIRTPDEFPDYVPVELRPLLFEYQRLARQHYYAKEDQKQPLVEEINKLLGRIENIAKGLASRQPTVTPVTVTPTAAAAAVPDTPTVPPVTKPKTFEPPAPQNMDLERPIVDVPVSNLKLSEDVPQFKYGANKKGVVEPLGGKFTTEGVAPIAVWQRLDGSLEVISGRHRFDLAQRSGTESIPAQIYYESQGFTAMDAAIKDAELNIRDDQGKVKDYVNYFKESGTDRATAESKGFLARDKGKRGFTIANQGSDELIDSLRADQVGDEAAFYIALNAPGDARLQGVGIKAIMDGKNTNTAINMMQAVKALAGENDTTTDMFGFDDSALREAEEMAKIAAKKQKEVQARLSAISGAARNPALAKAEGIDVRDPEAVKRRIEELRQTKAAWDNWSTNPQLVAEIRAARGVAAPTLTPVLQTQSEEELRQKAEQEAAATKREEDEKRKAEQKAKADEERDQFTLTGSDREADEAAARGQTDIFGAAEEAPAAAENPIEALESMGFVRLAQDDPRRYTDKGGKQYLTLQRGPVRIALSPQEVLFVNSRMAVIRAMDEDYYTLSAILVDPQARGQGLAREAISDVIKAADQFGIGLFVEPVPIDDKPMGRDQLVKFYESLGFESAPDAKNKVMMREASTKEEAQEEQPSLLSKVVRIFDSIAKVETYEQAEGMAVKTETARWDGKLNVNDIEKLKGLATKSKRGNSVKYSIVVESTADTSAILTFTARATKDKQDRGEVSMTLQRSQRIEWDEEAFGEINETGFVGASDKQVAAIAAAFKKAKTGQDSEANTRIFNNPAKGEIVKLKDTATGSGILKIAEAKKRIAEWKKNAQEQGKTGANSDKVVLSLFDLTGEWSKPWEEAGYQVFRFDIQADPEMGDVNKFSVEFFNEMFGAFDGQDVYAIIAACPCTDFASSGATHFEAKDEKGQTVESVELVKQTLRTIEYFKPSVWAIENPVGRIEGLGNLPPWRLSFDPWHFGDPYTKKSLLWGRFNADLPVAPVVPTQGSKMMKYGGKSLKTKNARSVTPEGFAYAFFQANNAIDNPAMAIGNKYDMLPPDTIKQALAAGLTEKEISNAVDDAYYDQDYDQADADLLELIAQKQEAEKKEAEEKAAAKKKPVAEEKPAKAALTPEQIEWASGIANEFGGEVVWQEGDYSLTRGYAAISGDPVYIPGIRAQYIGKDIEGIKRADFLPADVKQKMIEVKQKIEADAAKKHETDPFIKFVDGVAVSEGISPEVEGVIREWKKLLKLDVPIYVGTTEDAKANRNNYTGPHRRIASGTLDANDRGSTRRMSDGSHYILFKSTTSPTLMLETIAHEMGHVHQKLVYEKASQEDKDALRDAHAKWLEKQKGKTARELVDALRGRATQRRIKGTEGVTADQMSSYWKSFSEWYADQTSRWAVSGKVPVSAVEKFFKRLGNQLRRFYQQLTSAKYLPDETFVQYIERVTEKPADIAPPEVKTVSNEGSGIGAAVMGQRLINAADRFRKAAMSQHKLTKEQADAAMGRLIQIKVLNLDSVTGQFELRDGRFWNRDVLLKAASENGEDTASKMSEDLQPIKKLPPGRSPELAAAAQRLQKGEITAAEFDELVNKYKPIPIYFSPLAPATSQEVYTALDTAKREKIDPVIQNGKPVGLRLDIPAFNRHGVFVVSIHDKRTPSAPGKVIGYSSVASIKNVTFGVGNQKEALKIAAGAAKDAIQTMEGQYSYITPEEAYRIADDAILSDDWVQIGFDPTRHAYFFDRSTTEPVVAADEVIQIGNMILAKGVKYAPKASFLYNIDQGDLFGEPEAKAWNAPPVSPEAKTVKRGRSPELTEAAEKLRRGEITKAEYDAAVKKYSPVSLYTEPPKPATDKNVEDAVDANKRQYTNVDIATGTRVGLRLDIPAYERRNTWVVAIHEPKPKITSPKASAILSYRSVAGLRNVVFGLGDQARSLRIAAGEFKDKLQTMEGEYVDMTPEEAYRRAQELINDPNYVQIGFNPTRHAYFYDRATMQPVVKADEVIQIGNFILAKNVIYGRPEDFLYNVTESTASEDAALNAEIEKERIAKIRADKIQEYADLRAKIARITAKVAKGEVTLEMQQTLARTMQASRELQSAIRSTKPREDSAEEFLRKALTEFKDGNISRDVLEVIQALYNKEPELLDGLLLRVRKNGRVITGEFNPYQRVVLLFKGTSGVRNPTTIRHELTHSLEQMMSDKQRILVAQAWTKALQKAIKQNPDELHQKYFKAIVKFFESPTEDNYNAALMALPGYSMYQYLNPSEFWAVNAERLLAAQIGTTWEKFKRFVRGLFEGMKKLFGFDNRYDVHRVFAQVMGGGKERLNKSNLVNFVTSTGADFITLNNIEDEKDRMEKYGRPHTPKLDTSPITTFITKQFKNGKEFVVDAAKNPREAMVGAGDSVMDGLIYLRNKNVWYGSGLEARDFDRYNGELRISEGVVTASVALDNAIRSGNIGVEVIFRGGIKFDKDLGNWVAEKKSQGMPGVYRAEAELKKQLGDQLGTDVIQGYLEAKRSISIMNELYDREQVLETSKEMLDILQSSGADPDEIATAKEAVEIAQKEVESIKKAASSVNMSQEEMDEFAGLDQKYPELREIMDNWTAVNQNLLRMWRQVGLLSQGRYETLAAIKDYVPWYRIMDDELDLHDSDQSAVQSTTRSMTNIGREKLFKRGKPTSIVDFRAKQGQKDFKIQPSSVVQVLVNGYLVPQNKMTVTPEGDVRIDMDLDENDLVVFKTNREIQNIIDNMTRNVMRMTMNGIRQYAANRIVLEYASRNVDNKIMVFPKVDKDKGRFNWMVNGKKVVVEIPDPLVAASIYGMENLNLQMWKPLAMVANLTRRSITIFGTFQVKQVFKDAPTAALVTGVKNPLALIGGVYKGFLTSLTNTDPVVDILKAAGIGGYMSPARTPEADIKRRLGIMNGNVFSMLIKGLDHIGDASDMAQRVATYKRVLAETGNPEQALFQAANVINFLHHGSAGYAQAAVKTVPFLGAYANATDVLVQALMGGGLKGVSRKKALLRLGMTTAMLSSLTILYCMLAGSDPEYDELDDQTKLKNIIIPGTKIMLPMNTSAAYFFKAIPELIYNKVTREGTDSEMDTRRLRNALADAARDMLLGPEPVPAGVKQLFEVAINHDFFTGRSIIPEGLKDVEAAEQYTATTSELGKKLSAMLAIPGTDGKRVLNPIEADHIVRGVFGTAGAMAQWVTNSIGAMSETRPALTPREMPITGGFLRDEVPRGREDLFYDFKEATAKKYQTWQKMMDREDFAAAREYFKKYGNVAVMYEYVTETETDLKEINAEIRRLGETRSTNMSPEERRERIEKMQRVKQSILKPVKQLRRKTFGTDVMDQSSDDEDTEKKQGD